MSDPNYNDGVFEPKTQPSEPASEGATKPEDIEQAVSNILEWKKRLAAPTPASESAREACICPHCGDPNCYKADAEAQSREVVELREALHFERERVRDASGEILKIHSLLTRAGVTQPPEGQVHPTAWMVQYSFCKRIEDHEEAITERDQLRADLAAAQKESSRLQERIDNAHRSAGYDPEQDCDLAEVFSYLHGQLAAERAKREGVEKERDGLRDARNTYAEGFSTQSRLHGEMARLAEAAERDRDKLKAENAALRTALENLVNKLTTIHADETYKSVWLCWQNHCGPYNGPTYERELKEAKGLLATPAPSTGEQPSAEQIDAKQRHDRAKATA